METLWKADAGSLCDIKELSTFSFLLSSESAGRFSKTPPSEQKASQTTPLQTLSLRFVFSALTGFKLSKDSSEQREAVGDISKCRHRFSANVYQSKWSVFRSWCESNRIPFSKTTLTEIVVFHLFLRNS